MQGNADIVRNLADEPLHGMYVKAGPPKGFRPSTSNQLAAE